MNKQERIFRKVSLDRLQTPEQLDQKLTIISPMGWLALASVALLAAAALIWGFFGSISNTVRGSGVLSFDDGIVSLVSQYGGRVTDVSIRSGDRVEKGQVVARMVQESLLEEIEKNQETLEALEGITVETLALDSHQLNYEIYPEFASLAQQIKVAQSQYDSQLTEYESNLQEMDNEVQLQNAQVASIQRQIAIAERQLADYKALLAFQREVEIENAKDEEPRQVQLKGNLYYDDAGLSYRRENLTSVQQAVKDQVGNAYILLADGEIEYPVYYVSAADEEIHNPGGSYYLPNYYAPRLEEDGEGNSTVDADTVRNPKTKPVYMDQGGSRYIDLTGYEFSLVDSEIDSKTLEQLQNKPDYDATQASLELQLESYLLDLRKAELQAQQLDSRLTGNLTGAQKQTAAQLAALTEQFSQTKEIRRNDLLATLAKLREQLLRESSIVATVSGTAMDVTLKKDDNLQAGTAYASVIRSTGRSDTVLLYVPMDQGTQIAAGMDANIIPSTIKREEYGYILGRVTGVSEYAVSSDYMQQVLQNQQMVSMLAGSTAVMEVRVQLLSNPDTPSGYQWSTRQGPPGEIPSGTVCSGEIRVTTQRPVDLILPFLRKLFSPSADKVAEA